jgi:hypothetical protein
VGGFLGALLTGVLASKWLVNNANGNSDPVGNLADGVLAQLGTQATAAVAAAAYAFVGSLVLVKVIDRLWGFNLDERAENEGLDQAEHGEAGFDLGPTLAEAPEKASPEPRPARVPPDGRKRFTVVVDGPSPGELMHAWSALCQVGPKPPAPEFRAVYPYLTTVRGNRFHFRGGDPDVMRDSLRRLFQDYLQGPAVRAQVEG